MATVYLGLGSNLGDRAAHLWEAVRRISTLDACRVDRVSRLYETAPVGPPQPWYLNAVAVANVAMAPHGLLRATQAIEHEIGRVPSERWGPRCIDIDLLLFGEETIADAELVLPHPQLWHRRFVLAPLADVAGPGRLTDQLQRRLAEMGNEGDVRLYAATRA